MTYYLTIKGRIPSKKNSRLNFVRKGRIFNIPSNKYQEWHKRASMGIVKPDKPYSGRVEVTLFFYMPDNRRADMSNKAESILDFLVDNGVLADDNWKVVGELHLICKGVDKENPRCEIIIRNKAL